MEPASQSMASPPPHPQLPQSAPAFRNPTAAPSRMTHPSSLWRMVPAPMGGPGGRPAAGPGFQVELCLNRLPFRMTPLTYPTAAPAFPDPKPRAAPVPGTPCPNPWGGRSQLFLKGQNCFSVQQSSTPQQPPRQWSKKHTEFAAGGIVLLPREQKAPGSSPSSAMRML